jgi:hypothetical protein
LEEGDARCVEACGIEKGFFKRAVEMNGSLERGEVGGKAPDRLFFFGKRGRQEGVRGEEARLVGGLIRADMHEVARTIGGEKKKGHFAMESLHASGKKVADSCSGGGNNGGPFLSKAKAKSIKGEAPLVKVDFEGAFRMACGGNG